MRGRTIVITVALAAAVLVVGGGSAMASAPTFSFQSQQFALPDGFRTVRAIAVGDVDGQHGPDIVIGGFTGELAVYLNDGQGGFLAPEDISGQCFNGEIAGVAIGSFSTSGHADILVACGDALQDGFVRYRGNGDGTFQAPERAAPIQGYDGEDNQRRPVFVGNVITNMVHGPFGGAESIVWNEWIANGQYMLCTLPDSYFASSFGATECSITVNSNGTPTNFLEFPPPLVLGTEPVASPSDWAFTNAPQDFGLNKGSLLGAVHDPSPPPPLTAGFFSDNFEPANAVPGDPYPLAAGDLNGDGSSEIISGDAGANLDQIAVTQLTGTDNAGTILISQPQLFNTSPAMDSYQSAVVTDFDGDGNPDVAVLGTSFVSDCCEQIQVFPGDGSGSLGAAQEFYVADFTTESYLATGDFNGDGRPDLVTTIQNGLNDAHVTVFYDTTAPVQHTLTVGKSGSGTGSVSSSPAGIDCGGTCSAALASGTPVTLTATPAAGSVFSGWSGGGCSGTGTCVVTLSSDQSVTATFTATHPLSVQLAGGGSGGVTSSPAGIDCGATCSAVFDEGTPVTLSAAPAAGSSFAGWSGGGCSGTGTCPVTLSAAETVTATFDLVAPDTQLVSATINSSKHKAAFAFTAIGTANGFQCALKKGSGPATFKACSSPKRYRHLKPGKYVFEVSAVNAGLADPTPAKKTFKIKS